MDTGLEVEDFGPVLFCHGTPRDDEEVVLVDTRLKRWANAFADLPGEVQTVVCGHRHMPFVRPVDRRPVDRRLVVNPGRVGMPYGQPGGAWALLRDGDVTLRHTAIEVDDAITRIVAESGYPDRQAWAEEYLPAISSDIEALTTFAPRDGRPS